MLGHKPEKLGEMCDFVIGLGNQSDFCWVLNFRFAGNHFDVSASCSYVSFVMHCPRAVVAAFF